MRGEPGGLAPVAGGDVRAGEPVQPFKLVPGVAHVAAHRGVGPARLAVSVEAHVQLHEACDALDGLVVEAQGLHPPACDLGAHHLVMAEADRPGGLEAPGGRLADVVHQGREAQREVRGGNGAVRARLLLRGLFHDREGVLVDILVVVRRVRLELQGGHLGQHDLREPRLHHQLDAAARLGAADQLHELLAHALRRDDLQPRRHRRHGLPHGLHHVQAQLGREPCGAHHAQGVVREGVLRGAGRPQHPRGQVLDAAERVHELHVRQTQGHGVDREVPAAQVLREVVPESHRGLARVRVVVLRAVGGDLQLHPGLAHADGPELPANLPVGVRPVSDDRQRLVRARVSGEVQVQSVPAQQQVPHGTAHQGELVARPVEEAPQLARDGVE